MDALSDVLKSVRLEGALYLNAEFTAPWCLRGRYGLTSVRERLAGAEHVVFFHFLIEGRCKIRLAEGGDVIDVAAGDLVLFPRDDRHLMGSHLHLAPLETENLNHASGPDELVQIRHGGGGELTRFVCSYLACSRSLCRPLLEALPRVIRIPMGDGHASGLLRELLRAGVRESGYSRPGGDSMLARLAELMFVEALRRYIESVPPEATGWLAGVRDAQIGRALALLHGSPSRAWTVDALAHEVAMSRSALAERFVALVGEPPMQYLMRWRLALAAQMLRSGHEAVARVAERSGYESETAFTRAFKREFGVPPASWRKVATQSA
jgi:AraC-like DNA-binding protein